MTESLNQDVKHAEELADRGEWQAAARAFSLAADSLERKGADAQRGVLHARAAYSREHDQDWDAISHAWRKAADAFAHACPTLIVPDDPIADLGSEEPSWARLQRIWRDGVVLQSNGSDVEARHHFAYAQGECYMWAAHVCERNEHFLTACRYFTAAARRFALAGTVEGAAAHHVKCLTKAGLTYIESEGTLAGMTGLRPPWQVAGREALEENQRALEQAARQADSDSERFDVLSAVYRELRVALARHGNHREASGYRFKEMDARRNLAGANGEWRRWVGLSAWKLTCRYGESVTRWGALVAAVLVVIFPLLYCFSARFDGSGLMDGAERLSGIASLPRCVYFSIVTAATVGIGDISPVGLARLLVVGEIAFAVVMLVLLGSALVARAVEA